MATESKGRETVNEKPARKVTSASVLVPVAVTLVGVLFALEMLRGHFGARLHDLEGHPDAAKLEGAGSLIERKVGEALPDLTFQTLEGKTVKLSDIHANVVVINFWATWCGPCVEELPSLQKLASEYSSKGLTVIGVNLDEDPESVLPPFLSKHAIKYQSFVDPKGELADRFSISGLPLTLVIDSKRKLLLEQLGGEEWFAPELRKQFELWLGKSSSG